MKAYIFPLFLLLMLLGNCFALYKLFTDKEEYLLKFPFLTDAAFKIFRFLPLINIIALIGMWFFKSWAVYLALGCAVLIIAFDLYFHICYHLYAAVPSTLLLLFFIIRYWNHFK
jgi:hypothetical protein